MDNSLYDPKQQRVHDNQTSLDQNQNTFESAHQIMQNQFIGVPLFNPSPIWQYFPTTTSPPMAATSSTDTNIWRRSEEKATSILSSSIGKQGNRNLLVTDIPQKHYDFIHESIKGAYQDSIHSIFSKRGLGTVSLVVSFYDVDHAKQCNDQLNNLVNNSNGLNLVAVSFCSSALLTSAFGVELQNLQATHLTVSLSGASSNINAINYKGILESFGELHHLIELEHCQKNMALLVEYKDTRHTVKAQMKLDGRMEQGIAFKVRLAKLGVEQNNARNIQQQFEQSRMSFANQTSLQNTSSSMHIGGSHYSRFGEIGSQLWTSSLSISCHLRPPSTSPLTPPSLYGTHQQRRALHLVPSLPFTLRTQNTNVPLDRPNPTIPDSGLTLPVATIQDNYSIKTHQNDENVGLDQQFPATLRLPANHRDLGTKMTGLCTPTGSESETGTTSTFIPLSRYPSSSAHQPISASSSRPANKASASRDYHFDVDNVINHLDKRTTFMIRNIPNKYTRTMLMRSINATHRKTYDFLYLGIDFAQKSNFGYAFINFIDCQSVISFAKERVGKRWDQFNSEKVCQLSYAKTQGKANLIEKFRNSDIMNQEEAYRPIIFHSSGPCKGEREPFPGPTVVCRHH